MSDNNTVSGTASPLHESTLAETSVRSWLSNFVVHFNLCPFAQRELQHDSIRFTVCMADNEHELLAALDSEILRLDSDPEIETTLLIHPKTLLDFADFNEFLGIAEQHLFELGKEGVYQIASFHPLYQFAGTDIDDAENFTNRAPHPVLHLLREASLSNAIDSYPDTALIPERNIELMEKLGNEKLVQLLESY